MTLTKRERLALANASLEGLSVGDAFGEQFFGEPDAVELRVARREVSASPWPVTDDTLMAMSIVDVLAEREEIEQEPLAALFGARYRRDPARGYGGTAHGILSRLAAGEQWSVVSRGVFGGCGSMGNGGAMRAAPIGAYFCDDIARTVEMARRSAEVTHAHLEGKAGAVAVAVAASYVAGGGIQTSDFFKTVLKYTPDGETRAGIVRATNLPQDADVHAAVAELGNGSKVISQDTVPFALWCAGRHLHSYEEALWLTVSGLGDRDTTCAIVGGIVALHSGNTIPAKWLASRESLVSAGRL